MKTQITRRYGFSSAHWLPGVHESHKCHRLHGHNYAVDVTIEGEVDSRTGFIMDFADVDVVVAPLIFKIDHKCLNDYIENPTAELIGAWLLDQLPENVVAIRVYETEKCWADVRR